MADKSGLIPAAYVATLVSLAGCATQERQSSPQPRGPATEMAAEPTTFEEEWARAGAASDSDGAGKAWGRSINSMLEQAYGDAHEECAKQVTDENSGEPATLRIVLEMAGDGSVANVRSETDSPGTACVRRSFSRARFAPPPRSGERLGVILAFDSELVIRLPSRTATSISMAEARALADADAATAEGMAYMQSVISVLDELSGETFDKCMQVRLLESERLATGHNVLFEIAGNGETQRVMVEAEGPGPVAEHVDSPRAECYRNAISDATFPAPPWDNFWMFVGFRD